MNANDHVRRAAAISAVVEERRRQTEMHGWDAANDDRYTDAQLSKAAACYAFGFYKLGVFSFWPWDLQWWKPSRDNRKRDIEKAAALLIAEWERLDRLEGEE